MSLPTAQPAAPTIGMPTGEIAGVRGATSFFLRQLSLTHDAAFVAPSALPGWTIAEVVADVAYQARGLANHLEGLEQAIDGSAQDRAARILFGATLTPVALRHLAYHTAVHLNVVLRDVVEAGAAPVTVALVPGDAVPVTEALRRRTETLWLRSLDLGSGLAGLRDAPDTVPRRLIEGLQGWAEASDARIVALERRGAAEPVLTVGPQSAARQVRGPLALVGRWSAGRAPAAFEPTPPQRASDVPPAQIVQGGAFANAFAGA